MARRILSLIAFLWTNTFDYTPDADDEKGGTLEDELLNLGLNEKTVSIIIEHGQNFIDHPEALAKRFSIDVNDAKEALKVFKSYKIKQISSKQIDEFELLVKKNSSESLKEFSLVHGIDEDVISAYLAHSETIPLTESEKVAIKEHLDAGSSVTKIAEDLKISLKKINEYVENKFILFNGKDGEAVLAIIRKHFGRYPIVKLREMIAKKDMDLQEMICFELLKKNESEYVAVKDYFMKFEESRNFFNIKTLSIEAKTCIRGSSLDNTKELSVKLNVMERLIREYFLQYSPDKQLILDCAQDQFIQIQKMKENFLTDIQISHTTYRMILSDSSDTLIQNAKKLRGSPKKVFDELLPLTFYYLKCSLPLEEITQIINSITKIFLTTLDLFHLIFQMSDPVVRGLCIEHYSFSNPVPFYYPILSPYLPEQKSCEFQICKELWYSLQQFSGLVSFGLGWASWNPIGKSHLLDLMFQTDFVEGNPQNSPFHLGSIDIQMTKNLFGQRVIGESTQWAYIDCHRYSDINLIRDICQNLEIALIHVSYSDFRMNYSRLKKNLNTFTVNVKHVYVFVRDCVENDLRTEQVTLDCNIATFIFIPNLTNRDKTIIVDLRDIGYRISHSKNTNLRSVENHFLENMITQYGSWDKMKVEKESIKGIMNNILANFHGNNRVDFSSLSYYPHFVEYMRCYYETFSQTDQRIIDELNEKCELIANHLENTEMSAIVWQFNEILRHENSALILWKLSQELNLLSKQAIAGSGKTPFTFELLWREALLSSKYNLNIDKCKPGSKYFETFSSNFSNYVERGEPFELIDGDNLRFFNQDINVLLSKFYEKQFYQNSKITNKQRPPIVVSILGPQSSGKSTLLNYCFGCKFLTSAGRCTKGIYASLSKLSQPINDSDHFLILDTEGLDAIERGNTLQDTSCIHFDRTMVLFCLAVSQVVIINVKGDIGEEIQNLLQICAYSLNKLKVSKVKAPKIFFVLNQQADPDPDKHLSSINTLLEKLNKESHLMEREGLKISDLIQISKRNLFVLQSAFNSQSLNTKMTKVFDSVLCKLTPTTSFADKCADLRMSIIHQLEEDKIDNETPFNTMGEWMEMSGVIWDTIIKYQDIVKYRNSEELESSSKLSKIVSDLMKKKIYFNRYIFREITEKLIYTVGDINRWKSSKVVLQNVKEKLDDQFEEYQEEALKDFAEQCQTDPLLKKKSYLCDEAKSNLRRLIFMEKKTYEDKLKFEIKARLKEIKLNEKIRRFQEAIEKNADRYLELNTEEQEGEFEIIWFSCFSNDTKEEEETDFDEIFDDLYSVFRMESKTMENKSTIYTLFRRFNFEMDTTIKILCERILSRFCDESNKFAGAEQFIYPWRENKVPLKDMTPYIGKLNFEYLSKDSLYVIEVQEKRSYLDFRKHVPKECHPLIKYCSGYFNHPDIIWNPAKRKQILLLASKLKDPTDPKRSTWEKLISNISKRVQEFIRSDQIVSQSTVKEIVDFLSQACKLVNYEINFIEAKLTNGAERMISTLAFAFAFKSVLNAKFEEQRDDESDENERKENGLIYFLQKVKNRKSARGGWDRNEMRNGDLKMAKRFAGDFLVAVSKGISTACELSFFEEYFEKEADRLSSKNTMLQANEKVTEKIQEASKSMEDERLKAYKTHLLDQIKAQNHSSKRMPPIPDSLPEDFPYPSLSIEEENFVVQVICNRIEILKNLYQEEWKKVSIERLYTKIFRSMKNTFIKQISIAKDILEEFLKMLEGMCKEKDRLFEVGTDSDSNFEVANEAAAEEAACYPDPKTREAPFKVMVIFLEKYLNPKVSPEEFNQFFTDVFEIDGVKIMRHHDTYVLFEKPHDPAQELDEEIFQTLSDTNIFRNTETIFNIKVYIQEFLRKLNCYEYRVTEGEYESILKATKEQFEANIFNCPFKCPSCGKFCEKEIHLQESKCQILTGHQIGSMGGNVPNNDEDKTAILQMCDYYEEDSPVLIPEEGYVALQKKNRNQMIEIWNKYGKEILKHYANRGNQITYIPYTSPEEIYQSLFSLFSLFLLKYYTCFVIDGNNLMGGTIEYVKKRILDAMKDSQLEGPSTFKVIIHHGHHSPICFEKFPNNSKFTDDRNIENFLKNVTTYGSERNEFPMLHGPATAATESDWESGFGIRNIIVHFNVEATDGDFDIFTAECDRGCQFDWKRDISDKKYKMKVQYKDNRLILITHPEHTGTTPVNDQTPSTVNLNSEMDSHPQNTNLH